MELSSNLDVLAAIVQICLIDLLLSGDNAIVIAMACATLPADVRPRAVLLGTGVAVFFRVILTFVATLMLRAPYLKLVGAGLLLLIAIELMAGDAGGGRRGAQDAADSGVWRAVLIIVVADAVMSLDNVVAVAAAAQDNLLYLLLGLAISVPILVFSSLFIARLLDTHPIVIDAGAALLGWIAGKIAVSDPAIAASLATQSFGLVAAAPLLGALYVLVQGRRLRRERGAGEVLAKPGLAKPGLAKPAPAKPAPMATPVAAHAPAPAPAVTDLAPPAMVARTGGVTAHSPAPPPGATGTLASPPAAAPSVGAGRASAIPELDVPRRFSKMDLTIMGGVAVPLLGLIAMIIYFLVHAASARH